MFFARGRSLVKASFVIALAACRGAPVDGIATNSDAISFPNDQPAFEYFLGKGLTAIQAAGIVGNLDQESGVDPASVQGGGPGRGIAQWSIGGRWDTTANDSVMWYAAKRGLPSLSLQLQLDFIWYELTTFPSYGLPTLKQARTITAATVAFQNDFEGCGACNQSQRIAFAQAALASFGSDTVGGGDPVDGGVSCIVDTTNTPGTCMDVAACAALGGHTSTPGFCPGPSNVECCTATQGPQAKDGGVPIDSGVSCIVDTTNTPGTCMDVTACAALGGHTSTPGFCPGPSNVECCTAR